MRLWRGAGLLAASGAVVVAATTLAAGGHRIDRTVYLFDAARGSGRVLFVPPTGAVRGSGQPAIPTSLPIATGHTR